MAGGGKMEEETSGLQKMVVANHLSEKAFLLGNHLICIQSDALEQFRLSSLLN